MCVNFVHNYIQLYVIGVKVLGSRCKLLIYAISHNLKMQKHKLFHF